jgi:RNA polymerase sigma factor (TIGR02999 family)
MGDLTRMMNGIKDGEPGASDQLLPHVYEELRRLAAARMAQERPGQTIQATALVHEAYLRLVGTDPERNWDGRGHFFAAAAEAMRRILVEIARGKGRVKRGGMFTRVELSDGLATVAVSDDELIALDEALEELDRADPLSANVVRLRYFAGLTHEQVARELEISERTSERRWEYAKAWLRRQMRRAEPSPDEG